MAVAPKRNAYAAFQDSYDWAHDRRRQRDMEGAYASGDPEAVARMGDIRGAEVMTQRAENADLRRRKGGVQAGIAAKDWKAAEEAAGGDPTLLSGIDQQRQREAERAGSNAALLGQVFRTLAQIPDPQARAAHFAYARQNGLDAQLPGIDLSKVEFTDEAMAQQIEAMDLGRQRAMQFFQIGGKNGGIVALDKNAPDPQPQQIYTNPADPLDEDLKRAQIEAYRASANQRDAAAEKARRPPVARSGGGKISNLNIGLPDIEAELRRRGVLQ